MQSPPPPPPRAVFSGSDGSAGRLRSSSSTSSPSKLGSDGDFYICSMEEETPLIGSRKKQVHMSGKMPATTYCPTISATSIPEVPRHDNNENDDDDDDILSVSSTTSSASIVSVASLASTASSLAENFKESLLLPFTDEDGTNVGRGLLALTVIGTLLGIVLLQAQQLLSHQENTNGADTDNATTTTTLSIFLDYISSICGYNYLILWSICFYPQAIQNYRRQSTRGVSHDFAILNFMGWTFYSIYMSCLYFLPSIRELYQERFHEEKSTVALNDVLFATHAMCLAICYLLQILYYSSFNIPKRKTTRKRRRQQQQYAQTTSTTNSSNTGTRRSMQQTVFTCPVSSMPTLKLKNTTKLLVLSMLLPTIIFPAIIASNVTSFPVTWLDYLYMLSYFKICCTLTKYTKQVYFNYKRASTKGWNIWYNFLEASGGTLSMMQIALDAYILRDVSGITGNMAKFLLGLATIVFDFIFFMQHYVWYYAGPPSVDDDVDNDRLDENGGTATKQIPRHLRANSRFEIAIFSSNTSPVHGSYHDGYHGTSNTSNTFLTQQNAVHESEKSNEKRTIVRAQSDISLDSSSTNRSNEFIGRL